MLKRVLRTIFVAGWALTGTFVILTALLYVFLTSPFGMSWVSSRVADVLGEESDIRISIDAMDSDLHSFLVLSGIDVTISSSPGTSSDGEPSPVHITSDEIRIGFNLPGLIRGAPASVRFVNIDGLNVSVPLSSDTTGSPEWNLTPLLSYIPARIIIHGTEVDLISDDSVQRILVAGAILETHALPDDTSLSVSARVNGTIDPPGLEAIPVILETRSTLQGAGLTIHSATVEGSGIWTRGWAQTPDIMNGPWSGGGAAQADLARLPGADDMALCGVVDLMGTFTQGENNRVSASLRSQRIMSPWANASDIAVSLDTNESSEYVLQVLAGSAGGSVRLVGRMTTENGPFSATVNLRGIDLDSLQTPAAMRDALSAVTPSGKTDITATVSGSRHANELNLLTSSLNMSGDNIVISDIQIGSLLASWEQDRDSVSSELHALQTHLAVAGHARGVDDVDLTGVLHADRIDTLLHALGVDNINAGARIDLQAHGDLAAPTASLVAVFTDPDIYGIRPTDLHLSASISDNDSLNASLVSADTLLGAQLILTENLNIISRFDAVIGPWPIRRIPGNIEDEYGLETTLNLEMVALGIISNPHARVDINTGPIMWNDQSMGSLRGSLSYYERGLVWDVADQRETIASSGVWSADSGRACRLRASWDSFRLGPVIAAATGYDVKRLDGGTSGSVRLAWNRLVPYSMNAQATVNSLDLRIGQSRLGLINPPARFTFTRERIDLPLVEYGDETQRIRVSGEVVRGRDVNLTVELDSIRIDRTADMLTQGTVAASGYVSGQLNLSGPTEQPEGTGHLSATRFQWRSLAIDTLGMSVAARGDRLRLTDIFAKFPFGRLDGEISVNAPALGIPTSQDSIEPAFSCQLSMDKVGAIIPRWEGLRGGALDVTGGLVLNGRELAEPGSYRGRAWIDSIYVAAPYGRTVRTAHPVAVDFGRERRQLVEPLRLQFNHRQENKGEILIQHPPDTSLSGLTLATRSLSLENLRHVLFPLLKISGWDNLPDDLGGFVNADIAWNADVVQPEVTGNVQIEQPSGAGILADSLVVQTRLQENRLYIPVADLYTQGDTLAGTGMVDLTAESLHVDIETRHIELSNLILDLLPPLREQEPPPPWPTTLPLPGNSSLLLPLPPDAQGQDVNAPLSAYERIAQEYGLSDSESRSVALPLNADITIRGSLSKPQIVGGAQVRGGFLQLQALSEPVWFTDTLDVAFNGQAVTVEPLTVRVGAQSRTGTREMRLNQMQYTIPTGQFRIDLGIYRTKLTLRSVQPVIVPDRMRFARMFLGPLLTSYYSEPIGTFTVDGDVIWEGSLDRSNLNGDIRLFEPTLQMSIANPQAVLKPKAPTSMGTVLDNTLLNLSVITEDSLIVDNNLADGATVGLNVRVTGTHLNPGLQGRVDVSPGSVFRYLDREFTVRQGTVSFPDPEVLAPEIELEAVAYVDYQRRDGEGTLSETYMIVISVSGTAPDRLTTELTMYEGDETGTEYTNREDILAMLILGIKKDDVNNMAAQERFDSIVMNTGFATLSSALGTVIPVDRVTVRSEDNMVLQGRDDAEVEVTENFKMFGQPFSLRVITLVSQISALSPATADLQWQILNRPSWWQNVESLSLTVGTSSPTDNTGGSIFNLSQNETSADLLLRMRFK